MAQALLPEPAQLPPFPHCPLHMATLPPLPTFADGATFVPTNPQAAMKTPNGEDDWSAGRVFHPTNTPEEGLRVYHMWQPCTTCGVANTFCTGTQWWMKSSRCYNCVQVSCTNPHQKPIEKKVIEWANKHKYLLKGTRYNQWCFEFLHTGKCKNSNSCYKKHDIPDGVQGPFQEQSDGTHQQPTWTAKPYEIPQTPQSCWHSQHIPQLAYTTPMEISCASIYKELHLEQLNIDPRQAHNMVYTAQTVMQHQHYYQATYTAPPYAVYYVQPQPAYAN